jgi:hypothetical protein
VGNESFLLAEDRISPAHISAHDASTLQHAITSTLCYVCSLIGLSSCFLTYMPLWFMHACIVPYSGPESIFVSALGRPQASVVLPDTKEPTE